MTKVENFREVNIQVCGNCTHLKTARNGKILACDLSFEDIPWPQPTPNWRHYSELGSLDFYMGAFTHTCDRWVLRA